MYKREYFDVVSVQHH